MVNTIQTTRDLAGLPVGLHLKGQAAWGGDIDQSYAFFQIQVGELVNGSATLKHPTSSVDGDFTVVLDTHADDNGVAGASHHAELIGFTTHTKHAHADKATAKPLSERINGALLSIANIFSRLEKLENKATRFYTGWTIRGTELQAHDGERNKSICSVNLKSNFIACQDPLNPNDVNDARQILTIQTELGVIVLHTANSGEMGRIRDAVNANDAIPVNSLPLPEANDN